MAHFLPSAALRHLAALRMLLVLTVLTGIAYPLLVTGIAQVAFPDRANGSTLTAHGRTVASRLIGQNFTLPKRNPHDPDEAPRPDPSWFQPRPSAGGYDPTRSGASNLGPANPALTATVRARRAAVAAFDGVPAASVPADAVTASGSGLDPAISPASAYEQVNRVAKARHLTPDQVGQLVSRHVHGRVLGFLGQPYVSVVELNHALAAPRRPATAGLRPVRD
ncbi:potassium-transporting ATPase subunit KdpC [Streptomyces sp. NPDC014733]|uniref:potassium-transporting ATPase subunit KdpC n=1 Tax=Streptomyces sp. NPDC014733 TaxID=3364885 RepID=UPI0037005866